jgi:branched-chain amino acid aminotransferase
MSMSDRDGKIWMDGQLVDWRDARIHVLSHTLHYGCGAFEGVRAYNTAAAPPSSACASTPSGCSTAPRSCA